MNNCQYKNDSNVKIIEDNLKHYGINTACEEERCMGHYFCWSRKQMTITVLGTKCLRNCGFCAMEYGKPQSVDESEPERVAAFCKETGLKKVALTSVDRSDLNDNGAKHIAKTIQKIKEHDIKVTPVIGNMKKEDLETISKANPETVRHDIQAVKGVYPYLSMPTKRYYDSLQVFKHLKQLKVKTIITQIMLGHGERLSDIVELMKDIAKVGVNSLQIWHYHRTKSSNVPVKEYLELKIFEYVVAIAAIMGIEQVKVKPMINPAKIYPKISLDKYVDINLDNI